MPRKTFWNETTIAQMRKLAAGGAAHSEAAAELGVSVNSLVAAAASHKVTIARHTAEERAAFLARERDRDALKKQKKRIQQVVATHKAAGLPPVSKTSPAYRNQLPTIGDRTKSELRAMLAEAARNTAEMSV